MPPLPAARRFSRGRFSLACNTRRALPRSEDRGIDSQCANSVSRPAFAGFGHRRHVDYYHDCAGAGADGEQVDSNQEDGNLSSVPLCTLRWGSYPVPVRAPNRPFAAPFVARSPSRITCGVSVRFEHVSTVSQFSPNRTFSPIAGTTRSPCIQRSAQRKSSRQQTRAHGKVVTTWNTNNCLAGSKALQPCRPGRAGRLANF